MARISWTAERVLTAVLRKNEMGELPAKIGVCAAGTGYADCPYQMPAHTRADRYRLIDRLIAAGFTIKRTRVGETGATRYELFWGPSEEPDVPLVQQKDSAAAELRLENNKGGRA